MDAVDVFPVAPIVAVGPVSKAFLERGIDDFRAAAHHVWQLPYGYNSSSADSMLVFAEGMGTCTTKHGLVTLLAEELRLPVRMVVGIYEMSEQVVTGTGEILARYGLPYVPEAHCFLTYGPFRVDLTEGNCNGKKGSIEEYLYTEVVRPNMSDDERQALYLRYLEQHLGEAPAFVDVTPATALAARAACVAHLKGSVGCYLAPAAAES